MNRKKIIALLIYLSLQLTNAVSQQKIGIDIGYQLGSVYLKSKGSINTFANNSTFLNQKTFYTGIKYNLKKYFGLTFYVSNQNTHFTFSDEQSISINNGNYIKWEAQSSFKIQAVSGFINFYLPFRKTNKLCWCFSPGYTLGQIKPVKTDPVFQLQSNQIQLSVRNEELPYSAILLETGFRFITGKRMSFSGYAGFNKSMNTIYQGEYQVSTSQNNGNCSFYSSGTGFYAGFSMDYSLIDIEKKPKKLKYKPAYNENKELISINDREIKTKKEFVVSHDILDIQIKDFGMDDGDKISLFLNEFCILKKYTLRHKIKQIRVHLKPGMNKIIVYAHNLGKDPPNTASVVLYSGNMKFPVSIESNLGRCGGINIKYNP